MTKATRATTAPATDATTPALATPATPAFDPTLFSAATATRPCLCSCGATTKSRFVSGHDGRLKGQLLAAARKGDQSAKDSLVALGWDRFLVVRKADLAKAERAKAKAAKAAAKVAAPATPAEATAPTA